jgi:cytochrome c5|tara:strand:- start:348 stop:1124 length:777 start_codon:yes stop_codon:yes gene_type:complete
MRRLMMLMLTATTLPGVMHAGPHGGTSGIVSGSLGGLQEKTVKDGVFTADQAVRGRERYEATCQRCHGADLTGGAGRSLTGDVFLRDWTGLTLDGLFERMQSMPPGGSESLAADAYVDIISYVLERNGFPAGAGELSAGVLGGVRVEGDEGPNVVPNFALVWVVGCLTGSENEGWRLSDASEEARAADPAASAGDDLAAAEAAPLGDDAFELMYVFPSPAAYVGHKVETKGLLIRDEDGGPNSLNVTSVQSLAERCES